MKKILINLIPRNVTVYVGDKVAHVIPAAPEGSVPAEEIRENIYYIVDIRRAADRKDFIFAQQSAGPRRIPSRYLPYFLRFKKGELDKLVFLP
jgi:hypothetical protein